jgi:hypothetical protein
MSDTSSTAIVAIRSDDTMLERLALVGFLADYSGPLGISYRTDLRLFTVWLAERQDRLLDVQRTHVELCGRWLEDQGRARSTVGRRLSTSAGFYRFCEQEQILARSPAAHVRRPKQDYDSRTVGLDHNELGAFLVAAGLSSNRDHALASLLALNGLRISEALGADIDDLNIERGHRTLRVVRKGGKQVTIPLAPAPPEPSIWLSANGSTARSWWAYPVSASTGMPPPGSSSASPQRPGSSSGSHCTACATASSPPPWMPASRCVTCKTPPPTPTLEPRCATTGPATASTATPPTSCPPSWPAPPDTRLVVVPPGAAIPAGRRTPRAWKDRPLSGGAIAPLRRLRAGRPRGGRRRYRVSSSRGSGRSPLLTGARSGRASVGAHTKQIDAPTSCQEIMGAV